MSDQDERNVVRRKSPDAHKGDRADPDLPTKDEMVDGVINELNRHFKVLKRTFKGIIPKQKDEKGGDGGTAA